MTKFDGRLALQQRVLPGYRAPFFDALAAACQGGLSVIAGEPRPNEGIKTTRNLEKAKYVAARNVHLLSGGLYFCWQRGLTDWLEESNPDALIVEANLRYLSTPAAIRWMHRRGRPVIGWGLGAPRERGPYGLLRRRFLRSLDGVIAYSRRGAEDYLALGLHRERVFVAPNAVAPRPTAPPPARPAVFNGPPVILFVGRLQPRKLVDVLILACAALPKEIQPRLVIVGDGPSKTEYEEFASEYFPAAEFWGAQFGAQLDKLFDEADLFVLPGTGGLAVQEAMAHALPVIVAEGDGTQSDLVRSENGWLVPPGDLMALTETLAEALRDVPRLRRMGAQSYRIVAEEVNLESMVSAFISALNRVGATHASPVHG